MDANKITLEVLIEKLHHLFADTYVNVEDVQQVMESYVPLPAEWEKFAHFDPHRYTRNLVDTGNGKFNLILLCWGEGMGSGVHDHANAHCWMKVMDGVLTEKLYDWPDRDSDGGPDTYQAMTPRVVNQYKTGEVAYINDSIGLHRIENNSHSDPAVSLHLYSPPFDMCQSFDERTGKSSKCKVVFWSKYGERTPYSSSSRRCINTEQTWGIFVFNGFNLITYANKGTLMVDFL